MRIAWPCALACTAAAGCAQIFGLDPTSPPRDDAGGSGDGGTAIDAPLGALGMSVEQVMIGATVTTTPLDLSGLSATFLVTDSTDPSGLRSVPGTFANGAWSADIPTGTPTVEFTLPDVPTPIERLFAFGTRDQRGLYDILGDPGSQPAPATATVSMAIGFDRAEVAGDSYDVYTVGSWSNCGIGVAAGATSIQFSMLPYAEIFGSVSGRPLTAITTADVVLALRYVGNTLDGVGHVAPFNMTPGDNPLNTTIAKVTADQTLAFQVDPAVPATRFAKTVPATSGVTMSWALSAAPGFMTANTTGPQLAAASVASTDSGTISQAYANPFATMSWPATLVWSTAASRSFTPTGKPALALAAGLFTITAPTAGMHLTLPQGLPLEITIAGTALATDGMSIALDPTKAVEVTFVSDATGSTLYELQVYDLVVQNSATVYQLVLGANGAQADFVIPRAVFQVGHVYTLRAINVVGGFPTVGAGNLQNQNLPFSVGYLDSGAFTVTS